MRDVVIIACFFLIVIGLAVATERNWPTQPCVVAEPS